MLKKIKSKGQPLVSVLMTVYNAEKYVEKALLSIIEQTYRNLEIIVVNDGSTDSTKSIVEKLNRLDKRIKLINLKKNVGPSLASNVGIEQLNSNYVARMDADDISLPNRIEKQLDFLLKNPKVVVVGGKSYLMNEFGQMIGKKDYPTANKDIYSSLFYMNSIQHPNCMINRKLLPKKRIYYHNHSLLAHDLELFFEAAQYGELANLDEITLYYRQYKDSLSLRNPKITFEATVNVRLKALKEYNYKPAIKSLMLHYLQTFIISLVPNRLIYPLFKFIRIDRHSIFKQIPDLSPRLILNYPYKLLRAA